MNTTTVPARHFDSGRRPRPWMLLRISLAIVVSALLVLTGALLYSFPAAAATTPVGLGTVESYSVLGGQTVTNTGATTLAGDLGLSPGTAITGFPPGLVLGTTHAGDAVAAQAQSDLVIAYNDTASRGPAASISRDPVGQTLTDGVYASGDIALSGTLTLDGQGDPNSVFILQSASTLITASSSNIALVNGAQACNVYWQIGSSATLGTGSSFVGTILAMTSITVETGATVEGRALARNGSVTLDNNTFLEPGCDTSAPPTPTVVPTDTPTVVPTDTPTVVPTDTPTVVPTDTPTGAVTGTPMPTPTNTTAPTTPTDQATETSTEELARTGAGIFTSFLAGFGALLIVVGGVVLFTWRIRSRATH